MPICQVTRASSCLPLTPGQDGSVNARCNLKSCDGVLRAAAELHSCNGAVTSATNVRMIVAQTESESESEAQEREHT
jgi:hypothetical protein